MEIGIIIEVQFSKNEKLLQSDESHIIFGSGNFPHNGFNLNYSEIELKQFFVTKEFLNLQPYTIEELLKYDSTGVYDFVNRTDYQVWDYTNNYNLIGKIL